MTFRPLTLDELELIVKQANISDMTRADRVELSQSPQVVAWARRAELAARTAIDTAQVVASLTQQLMRVEAYLARTLGPVIAEQIAEGKDL